MTFPVLVLPSGRQRPRHGRPDRLHPRLELAFLESDLAETRERLEDLLLAGGLEILRDRVLERGFILSYEPTHAIELFDPPCTATCHAGCEVAFLVIKQILERIHGAIPQRGGLLSNCWAPGTGVTHGRRRPTNSSMTGWNHSLESMPPAFTMITSGATSGSVVSGEPQRGQ